MENKTFTVMITETLQRIVRVKAKNKDEAYDKVREQYQNEDIVLDSADYIDTEFEVVL